MFLQEILPELHYPGKIRFQFRQSSLGAASNDLVGNVLGHRLVVRRLHDILATALGLGTQVGGVAEHLSQRNESVDTLRTCHCFHALDLATASIQVADDIAQILIGNDDSNLHDGLGDDGVSLAHSVLEGHRTCDGEGHFRGVDLVIRTIVQRDLDVDDRVPGENTGEHGALNTGVVPLGNMEAIQFHPTGSVPTDILMTEGCRGDGGTLLDVNEYRFMPDYEPEKAELASRDVVSRRMTEHMRKGFGVKSPYGDHLWLDIRHLGEHHITTKLREIYDICTHFLGVNPIHQLIPVRPTQHYSMGGVRTDKDGHAYGLKGLFAAGEAACWDLHGFNRLGGNSLAETVVSGRYIGSKMVEYLKGSESVFKTEPVNDARKLVAKTIDDIISCRNGKENCFDLRNAMQDVMMDDVGIFRNAKDLQNGVDRLLELSERAKHIGLHGSVKGFTPELSMALRVPGMIKLALCTAYGALQRTESRGAHTREDFPARNDAEWLTRTLAYWKEGDSLPTLKYEDASPWFELPPGERGYGGGKIIPAEIPADKIKTKEQAEEAIK